MEDNINSLIAIIVKPGICSLDCSRYLQLDIYLAVVENYFGREWEISGGSCWTLSRYGNKPFIVLIN